MDLKITILGKLQKLYLQQLSPRLYVFQNEDEKKRKILRICLDVHDLDLFLRNVIKLCYFELLTFISSF